MHSVPMVHTCFHPTIMRYIILGFFLSQRTYCIYHHDSEDLVEYHRALHNVRSSRTNGSSVAGPAVSIVHVYYHIPKSALSEKYLDRIAGFVVYLARVVFSAFVSPSIERWSQILA